MDRQPIDLYCACTVGRAYHARFLVALDQPPLYQVSHL